MNTPAHLLLGAATCGRGRPQPVIWAAMLGGLLPDLSLYLLAGASLFLLDIPPRIVFDELYFSDLWQTIFAIDNSFFVWGALMAIALMVKRPWAIALCGAALLHVLCDFPLHHDDGRAHFWPVSSWVYESPISYWDKGKGAFWVAPVEATLALVAAVILWRQRQGFVLAGVTAVLLVAEFWIVRQWLFFFIDT